MFDLQLPAIVWIFIVLIVIIVPLIVIWLRRNYQMGKITFKAGPVETELDRKPTPAAVQTPPAAPPTSTPASNQRTQDMLHSPDGDQSMHGKGGIQKQKMTDSPRGKQRMD